MTAPLSSDDELRQQLHDFAVSYRVESKETRIADLDEIMTLIRRDRERLDLKAQLASLQRVARVYQSLPEISAARENTCIALFAAIRQLESELAALTETPRKEGQA